MGDAVVGHQAVGEIIDAVGKTLSRLASRELTSNLWGYRDDLGVAVLYSRTRNGIVRFRLVTADEYRLDIDYDVNATSRRYIDEMMDHLMIDLERKRAEEQRSSRIILPTYGVTYA